MNNMKKLIIISILIMVPMLSLAEDKQLKDVIVKLSETSIRLEEQNKAICSEVKLLREDMNKRFKQVDKRFDQIDKRFDLFLWIIAGFGVILGTYMSYMISNIKKITVLEEKISNKLEIKDYICL